MFGMKHKDSHHKDSQTDSSEYQVCWIRSILYCSVLAYDFLSPVCSDILAGSFLDVNPKLRQN